MTLIVGFKSLVTEFEWSEEDSKYTWETLMPAAKGKNCSLEIASPSSAHNHVMQFVFGDIWMCFGQSNMYMKMEELPDAKILKKGWEWTRTIITLLEFSTYLLAGTVLGILFLSVVFSNCTVLAVLIPNASVFYILFTPSFWLNGKFCLLRRWR